MSTNRYQGVDPILTNVSIGYKNAAYIADQVFPAVPVALQSAKHFVYNRGHLRLENTVRSAGAGAKEVTHTFTVSDPYFCEDHALKEFVTDEDVDNNVQTGNDPFVDATENVTSLLDVAREKELADMLTSTANLTQNTTLSGTSQFSDFSNSNPFSVIETAHQTIQASIFLRANTMILGRQVFDKLKLHPGIIERFKYTSDTPVNEQQLASLFGVSRLLVADPGYVTSAEGQTETTDYIWGKHIILAYIDPNPKPKTITLGFKYQWKKRQVKRLRGVDEEDRVGTWVRVGNDYYDQVIVAAGAGYLIKDAVA